MGEALAIIELMIQDESLGTAHLTETKHLELPDDTLDRFMDGPASRRVGIVDFDPATGAPLGPPATYTPLSMRTPARGRFNTGGDRTSPASLAVNAFGTVFETIHMFEERAGLGRQVRWAFGSEQILVVPRAGEWANSFYERATRSLQFFWFNATNGHVVYTALSRDIVAHECGHALLDAVVPSLYDAVTPESIAIHEAFADLVAVLMALRSRELTNRVLKENHNSISNATWFSSIAEEFGEAQPDPNVATKPHALRDLLNDNTMTSVDSAEPHVLSTVLSAILYETLVETFEHQKARIAASVTDATAIDADRGAGRALGIATRVFRRLLLRGVDYLPPGDLTFADVGRALLAADRAALADADDPETATGRQRFAERFVKRGIIKRASDLDVTAPTELSTSPERLADLLVSDWEAYHFVETNRATLKIPRDASFEVLPRIDAIKEIGRRLPDNRGYATQRELILKVSWTAFEDNGVEGIDAQRRRVPTGLTLAWRWDDGTLLALVRSDATIPRHTKARDEMLRTLVAQDLITVMDPSRGILREGDPAGAEVRITGDGARIFGTQRLLHIATIPDDVTATKKGPRR